VKFELNIKAVCAMLSYDLGVHTEN